MFDNSRTICRHHHLTAYVIALIGIFLIFTINDVQPLSAQELTDSEATEEESDGDDQATTGQLHSGEDDSREDQDSDQSIDVLDTSRQSDSGTSNIVADNTSPPQQPPPEDDSREDQDSGEKQHSDEVERSTQSATDNNADRTQPQTQPPPEQQAREDGVGTSSQNGSVVTEPQTQPQNGGGGQVVVGRIHRSTTDGFQIQVPAGRVVEDIENTNLNTQTSEQQSGYTYLARICPLDSALIDNGGGSRYQCEEGSTANVNVMRFNDLHQRPEFASGNNIGSNNIITTSDFLLYYIQFWQRTAGISDVQIRNNIDTTINVIDAQTNQIVATIPAKLVEYTYLYSPDDGSRGSSSTTMTQGREFTLLVVNGSTGYSLYHEGSASSLPSWTPPAEIDQMFRSFTLLVSPATAATPGG